MRHILYSGFEFEAEPGSEWPRKGMAYCLLQTAIRNLETCSREESAGELRYCGVENGLFGSPRTLCPGERTRGTNETITSANFVCFWMWCIDNSHKDMTY